MATILVSPSNSTKMEVDVVPKAGRVILYDSLGNPLVRTSGVKSTLANQTLLPVGGYESGAGYSRPARMSPLGILRTTSDTLLMHDAFEGSAINTQWQQVTSGMSMSQSGGILTLNSTSVVSPDSYAAVQSYRQFPKYPRQPLHCHFRLRVLNLGVGTAAVVFGLSSNFNSYDVGPYGAYFYINPSGSCNGWVYTSNNGGNTGALAGPLSTIDYYDYDIFLDDDVTEFIIRDSNGALIADAIASVSEPGLTFPSQITGSHISSFAGVWENDSGGAPAQQAFISAHEVTIHDILTNKPWTHQMASVSRQAAMTPTTYGATMQMVSGSAPSVVTPSNSVAPISFLGGEYAANLTPGAETVLSLFGAQITAPYTFFLTGIYCSIPQVYSSAWNISTTEPVVIPYLVQNCASGNLSSGGGIYIPLPGTWVGQSLTAGVGSFMAGSAVYWNPQTPVMITPGNYIHLAWKVPYGGAVTSGIVRGVMLVDGYFE